MISIYLYDKSDHQLAWQFIKQVALIEKKVQPKSFWSEKVIADLLALEHTQLLIAVSDGQGKPIVAYCLYQTMFENSEILRMGTHPKWQRQGIAQRLLEQLFQQLRQQDTGIESLLLEVRADNDSAISLYKKQGFQQIDCRKGYYTNNDEQAVDGLVMKKQLT